MNPSQLLTTIQQLSEQKEKIGRFPFVATFKDLVKETGQSRETLRPVLIELFKSGKIHAGQTINDSYFKVKTEIL